MDVPHHGRKPRLQDLSKQNEHCQGMTDFERPNHEGLQVVY